MQNQWEKQKIYMGSPSSSKIARERNLSQINRTSHSEVREDGQMGKNRSTDANILLFPLSVTTDLKGMAPLEFWKTDAKSGFYSRAQGHTLPYLSSWSTAHFCASVGYPN